MMEQDWGFDALPPGKTGATPKGQSQTAPATRPKPETEDVGTALRSAVTITSPAPVFNKR